MLFHDRLTASILPRPVKLQQLVFVFHSHFQACFESSFLSRQ